MSQSTIRNKLKVWWIPQVPGKPFDVPVDSVRQGVKIMDVLAEYDRFQYENNIKPDYCNAGGLLMWDDDCFEEEAESGGWVDWYDEETMEDDPAEHIKRIDGGGDPEVEEE